MVYQMSDSLGGLVFLVCVIASLILISTLIYRAIKHKTLLKTFLMLVGLWVFYFVAVAIGGILSTERLIPIGSTECFDDWCASVNKVTINEDIVLLDILVENRARRVTQTPDHPRLVILDAEGNKYNPVDSVPAPLDSRLQAGETFTTQIRFELPRGVVATRALLAEGTGPPGISDQNSFLHKKTYFDLSSGI